MVSSSFQPFNQRNLSRSFLSILPPRLSPGHFPSSLTCAVTERLMEPLGIANREVDSEVGRSPSRFRPWSPPSGVALSRYTLQTALWCNSQIHEDLEPEE